MGAAVVVVAAAVVSDWGGGLVGVSVVDGLCDADVAVDDYSQLVVISFFFSQAEEVAVMNVLSQSLSLPRVATYSHFQMVQSLPLVILG